MAMPSLFVLGGARSGKSRYAQHRAEATGLSPVYIATAQAWDDEMRDRIRLHQQDRGPAWSTVEAPLALAEAIRAHNAPDAVVLVDCLTLWVTNLLLSDRDIPAATTDLTKAIACARGNVVLVSNEVGLGIVPENALARRFRDEAGRVNQVVAAAVGEVQFVAAGLNLRMK
ncbi:bifunctional adenosylcobinamide kinase/adenosylcobinamide-phosphate guanylyltransferase (plasmid) [Novosphingobium sp. ES2-1]|nr:bifunctional adenosylcobinamide kinase/adenosylcobinamide-phosphate guanylyltransferase [Novosphingobium sp. ES2-1]QOV96602.1 bifunctional adenosylcobinamide kinase/adenosylcobinamide-phosphate guanylyltransferase [Novosphingobium sp. ES2-1]